MIQAIAIDDEPPALKVIEEFCSKIDFVRLQKTFTKPTEAVKHLHKFPADLVFLDIRMPSMSGIQLNKSIPQHAMVIFTTAYSEYAVEGFNLNAVDFLLKPFTFQRFLQAVKKADDYFRFIHQRETPDFQHLFIRADYSLIKIAIPDICYIEGLDDYLKIHLNNQRPVVARITMKALLEKLPANEFVRVHRSFIVPLSKIQSIRKKFISLPGAEIPIGAKYEQNFFSIFKK
jgi:two-component system, LytTR family, response regulator